MQIWIEVIDLTVCVLSIRVAVCECFSTHDENVITVTDL